jgi:hypothetical protein
MKEFLVQAWDRIEEGDVMIALLLFAIIGFIIGFSAAHGIASVLLFIVGLVSIIAFVDYDD